MPLLAVSTLTLQVRTNSSKIAYRSDTFWVRQLGTWVSWSGGKALC